MGTAVVVSPRVTARADVLVPPGLKPTELLVDNKVIGTYIAADPTGATAVPGVWVAGNVTELGASVINAATAGLRAAGAINADLVAEDVRYAVALRRRSEPFSARSEREVCERVLGDRRHGVTTGHPASRSA